MRKGIYKITHYTWVKVKNRKNRRDNVIHSVNIFLLFSIFAFVITSVNHIFAAPKDAGVLLISVSL